MISSWRKERSTGKLRTVLRQYLLDKYPFTEPIHESVLDNDVMAAVPDYSQNIPRTVPKISNNEPWQTYYQELVVYTIKQ